ncbi:MAG: response regulator [Alphaproteobacteria bacterium]|nr:response regulator [Alphaproteobacteria bacterium]MBU0796409.1 response regulator [Alphaproteobacteria bacterium]MBU0886760.1 response regulator [Alphaproteobacteria bacterium]MBU1812627.1 response regulator [Alphaproteobacteria bacterium]MBU2089047.1 response regulator [Alphaproteobacteria bacterium]
MTGLNRILYVEDEPDIREIGELALVDVAGFEVKACASGAEALEKGPAFGPDLVLLDVMMPGMDGITTFQKLRETPELAGTPVIFMTAKVQTTEVQRYLEMGALDVIPKPFDPMTLGETIRRIWSR